MQSANDWATEKGTMVGIRKLCDSDRSFAFLKQWCLNNEKAYPLLIVRFCEPSNLGNLL